MSCSREKLKKTFIGQLDPVTRIAACTLLAITVIICDNFYGGALALISFLIMFYLSGQTLRHYAGRLAAVNLFILPVMVVWPFGHGGEVLFRFCGIDYGTAGLLEAGRLLLRVNALFLLSGALIMTIEPLLLAGTLRRLYFPARLAELIMFSFRYLEVIHEEYWRMRNAMKARGFRSSLNLRCYRTLASALSFLLLKSLDRAERVKKAMKARGYNGTVYLKDRFNPGNRDIVFSLLAVVLIIGMFFLEFGL